MKKGLNILIVEDKILLAEDLSNQLETLGYNVIAIYPDGESVLRDFERLNPDLVLMDIRLEGEMDGIQTAMEIDKINQTPIIYITAHADKNTVERASKTFPFAYIVKPFDSREIEISIDLAIRNFAQFRRNEKKIEASPEYIVCDAIFVKKNSFYEKVRLTDILYAEASGSYTHFQTKENSYTLSMNLQNFSQKIESEFIVRVHRSYLVNLTQVDRIESHQLTIGTIKIPISKSYKDNLSQHLRII